MSKPKLVRVTTVPISMDKLLYGQLRFMSNYFEVVAISSDREYLERVGVREGVRTFPITMSRKITPLADFLAICKLYFFLRKLQFMPEDIVSALSDREAAEKLYSGAIRRENNLSAAAGI